MKSVENVLSALSDLPSQLATKLGPEAEAKVLAACLPIAQELKDLRSQLGSFSDYMDRMERAVGGCQEVCSELQRDLYGHCEGHYESQVIQEIMENTQKNAAKLSQAMSWVQYWIEQEKKMACEPNSLKVVKPSGGSHPPPAPLPASVPSLPLLSLPANAAGGSTAGAPPAGSSAAWKQGQPRQRPPPPNLAPSQPGMQAALALPALLPLSSLPAPCSNSTLEMAPAQVPVASCPPAQSAPHATGLPGVGPGGEASLLNFSLAQPGAPRPGIGQCHVVGELIFKPSFLHYGRSFRVRHQN